MMSLPNQSIFLIGVCPLFQIDCLRQTLPLSLAKYIRSPCLIMSFFLHHLNLKLPNVRLFSLPKIHLVKFLSLVCSSIHFLYRSFSPYYSPLYFFIKFASISSNTDLHI